MGTTLSPFNRRKFNVRPQPVIPATISDFSGGLNAVDNDVTMKTKFAKVLTNWQQDVDGSQAVRWGTGFRYDVTGVVTGDIIGLEYFNDHLVVFTTTGQIAKITLDGTITAIWNSTIAGALSGSPSGWSTGLDVGTIDTTEFKGQLVVCNGVDKPLLIDTDMTVDYLQDLAVGTNVNTPIGQFCTTVANYVVIAGIASVPGSIYISSAGTSGVYLGDAAPNDGIAFALDTFVPQNSKTIIGLASFRNALFVFFDGAIVPVTLGEYDSAGNHTPIVQDNIIGHGVINFRTVTTTQNDLIMSDMLGVHAATQNSFGRFTTKPASALIEPVYLPSISFDADARSLCFSVYNKIEHRMMTFIPDGDGMVCWVLTFEDGLKNPRWSRFTGLVFDCGCMSKRGRVFLATGTKIFQYGNGIFDDEDYTADLQNNTDGDWAASTAYVVGDYVTVDDTSYVCLSNHTSGSDFADDLELEYWEEYLGEEITFDWEMPWTAVNARTITKQLQYLQADTQGTAGFEIDVFIDNYYKDVDDEYDPAVSMQFVAGDSGGYGVPNAQNFGGGRRLRDERPWDMPASFKVMKMRLHGSTRERLRIITISIMYTKGSSQR